MKRGAIIIAVLYGGILLFLTWPFIKLAFLGEAGVDPKGTFADWHYWAWIVLLLAGQWTFLSVPVRLAERRPVTKRALALPVAAASLMMGMLVAGCVLAVGEAIREDALYEPLWWAAIGELALAWLLWASIFSRWSRGLEPKTFIGKQCRAMYRGSVLELLVAVPLHIYVRGKDYCCAGFATFVGIAFGLAVMLFSFGPGVYFLYAERWKRLHPENTDHRR